MKASDLIMSAKQARQLMVDAREKFVYDYLLPTINYRIEEAAKHGYACISISDSIFEDAAQQKRVIYILRNMDYNVVCGDEDDNGMCSFIIGWE